MGYFTDFEPDGAMDLNFEKESGLAYGQQEISSIFFAAWFQVQERASNIWAVVQPISTILRKGLWGRDVLRFCQINADRVEIKHILTIGYVANRFGINAKFFEWRSSFQYKV